MDSKTNTRKLVSMPDSLWQKVNDFRFRERISSETEAFRQLIVAGLGAKRNARKRTA